MRPDQCSAATRRRQIVSHLADKADRDAFVRHRIDSGLAFQIHAMRRYRGLSQAELARELGKPQSVISRLEDPRYGRYSLNTLLEVATRFDVALLVAFVPFSELVDRAVTDGTSPGAVLPHAQDEELHAVLAPQRAAD